MYNTGGLNPLWTLNNNSVYNPYHININGNYQLTVTNIFCCSTSASIHFTIHPEVIAVASNDDNILINTSYQLNGSGGINYLWSPSYLLNNPTIQNPTTVLNHDTRFYLTVMDAHGCTDIDSVLIKVYDGQTFYVPNAFTPDGDGLNDVFRPTYVGLKNLEYFRVYNRYGQLMFETNDIGRAWDGRFKGIMQNLDNYIFVLKGIDKYNKEKFMKGNVMLLR